MRMRRAGAAAVLSVLLGPTVAHAQLPTNDLEGVIGMFYGQTPLPVAVQRVEPKLEPVPEAACDAQSSPLKGLQGRVTRADVASPQAAKGWTCNTEAVGHHRTPGGFRVWRFDDRAGHRCLYYDSTLVSQLNVVSLGVGPTQGVIVLDVSDPARPVQTDRLTSPAMLSPHESLNLNTRRGLLAAELGNVGSLPGVMAVYDLNADCRHPVLQSEYVAGPVGHESGFSPDGMTFWIGGLQGIIAVDVSNPKAPRTITTINMPSHGINFSADGNTLYETNVIDGGVALVDVSEIQARRPDPKVYEISRLDWASASIPQNTDPVTIGGHPYLLEYDEFAFRVNPVTIADTPGAARLIDLADPKHPTVTSNLRLQVNMPEHHREANTDPNFIPSTMLTYAAHYCSVPRVVDPQIAACSFLNSGLRIFDIRDPEHPREAAYFIAPPGTSQGVRSASAFSQPAYDPAQRIVYYTDATTGLWAVKLSPAVWPDPIASPPKACRQKTVVLRLRGRRATVTVAGRRITVTRKKGRLVARVPVKGTVRVRISVRTQGGRTLRYTRTLRRCG